MPVITPSGRWACQWSWKRKITIEFFSMNSALALYTGSFAN
jgi:hypothetical protein